MARLGRSDDLYADLLSSPDPSTSGGNLKDNDEPEEIWICDEEENTMPALDEDKLKNDAMSLYAELLESDIDNRKKNTQVISDYEDLQKQISHLKALIAEKDAKLSALTVQDANVRKNICSLYKTAKAEIDHKNSLLAEANKQVDNLLYRRNLTVDQLQKQMPQTSNEIPCENCKSKSNEDKSAGRENPKDESNVFDKNLSDSNKNNVEQSSTKRKRSQSPPCENKNLKTEKDSLLDKKQNCGSKNVCSTPQPVSKDNLNKKQCFDTNSSRNPTKLIRIEISDGNKSNSLNTGHNPPSLANDEHSNKEQNCDLNSEHNSNHAPVIDKEPSIAECFLKMQELASVDPAATDMVFFNLLPPVLSQSFLEFERTQAEALHKLKQSFVTCYFRQFTASDPGPSSEENSGSNAGSQNPPNSSHSENDGAFSSNNHSDSVSDSRVIVSEANKGKTKSDVKESGNKPASNNLSDTVSELRVTVSQGNKVKTNGDVKESCKKSASNNHPDSVSEPRVTASQQYKRKTNSDAQESSKKSASNNHSDSVSEPRVTVSKGNVVETESYAQESGKKPVARQKLKKKDVLLPHSIIENNDRLITSNKHSDSVSMPQETVINGNEVITESDVQKSGKKRISRQKSKKKDVLSLPKYRDKSLTLYTQRNIRKHQS